MQSEQTLETTLREIDADPAVTAVILTIGDAAARLNGTDGGEINNSGSITAKASGIQLDGASGIEITNSSGGTISSTEVLSPTSTTAEAFSAIALGGLTTGVSIDNSGTISAAESGIGDFSTSNGVPGTQLNNRAGGVISGGENGVVALKMDIVNSGTITGATVGIAGNATGGNGVTVENQEGATISATGSEGFAINLSGDVNEITNAGLIDGADDGVLMASDSTLTNNATGTIDGKGGVGVVMLNGGDVTNEADSDTGAEGLIKGATQAVRLNEIGQVLNSGMIEGGEDGVLLVEGELRKSHLPDRAL